MKNMMTSIRFLFLTVILNACFTEIYAQNNLKNQIDSLMQYAHKMFFFNGNVLVIEKGQTIYEASLGYADASKTKQLTADYRFNIGSIGKEFNAVGIMILKEEGKLSLDDKVSKFMTDLPAWASKVSIKNLLQYTSGLPDVNWETAKNDADVYDDLKKLKTLTFEPGTNYHYNNNNVFLQRRIIEKITGISFAKFVETRLLKPCKMKNSVIDPDLKGKNIAVSFNNDFKEDPKQNIYTMSGWTSVTARDLYKWQQNLHQFKLINTASFREILLNSASWQAGLGAGNMENGIIKEHYHHGTSIDFEALMYSLPSEGKYIYLLTNNANYKVFEIKDAIKAILEGKPFKMPKKSILQAITSRIEKDKLTAATALKVYDELKAKFPNDFNFDNENELNQLGYGFMGSNLDDAIRIFELNVKLFPTSSNPFDSWGEAYLAKGDKKNAAINYKKSYELDNNNTNAKAIFERLEKEK